MGEPLPVRSMKSTMDQQASGCPTIFCPRNTFRVPSLPQRIGFDQVLNWSLIHHECGIPVKPPAAGIAFCAKKWVEGSRRGYFCFSCNKNFVAYGPAPPTESVNIFYPSTDLSLARETSSPPGPIYAINPGMAMLAMDTSWWFTWIHVSSMPHLVRSVFQDVFYLNKHIIVEMSPYSTFPKESVSNMLLQASKCFRNILYVGPDRVELGHVISSVCHLNTSVTIATFEKLHCVRESCFDVVVLDDTSSSTLPSDLCVIPSHLLDALYVLYKNGKCFVLARNCGLPAVANVAITKRDVRLFQILRYWGQKRGSILLADGDTNVSFNV